MFSMGHKQRVQEASQNELRELRYEHSPNAQV
jgi:hypothetical protein